MSQSPSSGALVRTRGEKGRQSLNRRVAIAFERRTRSDLGQRPGFNIDETDVVSQSPSSGALVRTSRVEFFRSTPTSVSQSPSSGALVRTPHLGPSHDAVVWVAIAVE